MKTKITNLTARENYHELYGIFPSGLFSLDLGMWLRIWHCSVCEVLFSVPFDLCYIVNIFPVIKSSIVCMYHNLFYSYVLFGHLGRFKFFTLVRNAGCLFVNEYLIASHIFCQVESYKYVVE